MADDKKKDVYGSLEVKVLEVKDVAINFATARFEQTTKMTEIKKSSSKTHQYTDEFKFKVLRPQGDLEIEVWKKHLITKDTLEGFIKIPFADVSDEQVHSGWYPLATEKKKKGEAEKETKSKGEIRLELKFILLAAPKEVLRGISIDDTWAEKGSAGSLINNPRWVKNKQFLLTVLQNTDVTVRLRMFPEGTTHKGSFCVIRYDSFYNGRNKVSLDPNEIVKVDNFFCPITAPNVDATLPLTEGEYVVIPFTETLGLTGDFLINAYAKTMDDIDFVKLPKDDDHQWKEHHFESGWNHAAAGGGDVLGLTWHKNPQFVLTITKKSDVAVVLNQEENSKSIGVYVIKQTDPGYKAVEYTGDVGKTESFKHIISAGVHMPHLEPGNYIILPATYEPNVFGPFTLIVYTSDQSSTCEEVKTSWEHYSEIKSEWKDGTAGGSPNTPETFPNNPQFQLIVPASDKTVRVLVQVVQEAAHFEETGIGFFVMQRKDESATRLVRSDIQKEDIFAKPEGWVQKIDVVTRFDVKPEDPHVFTIIPSTFKPDINRSFTLNVFANSEVKVEALP